MEFNEKLQKLRKSKGLTQEELAEALYVSRTAISKWESGRGYPSIDSLKEIANYFSVTIDELLSGEKIISIAEKENKSNIKSMCDLLFGMVDIFSVMLIFLPLYPNKVEGYIYSVNLFMYDGIMPLQRFIYWFMFVSILAIGIVKVLLTRFKIEKSHRMIIGFSMILSILIVFILAMARESYAVTVAFMLLIMKGILLLKYIKAGV